MSAHPDDIISAVLTEGEESLWVGRPRAGIVFRAADILLIPFSLMWGGFAIFWTVTVLLLNNEVPILGLFGLPFVLVGLYLIFGRFLVDAWQREATTYGLTTERAVIVSGLWSRSIKSLSLDTLTDVTLIERSGGWGTITLGPGQRSFHSPFEGTGWPGMGDGTPKFDLIENAAEVYAMLRQAQRAAKQRC